MLMYTMVYPEMCSIGPQWKPLGWTEGFGVQCMPMGIRWIPLAGIGCCVVFHCLPVHSNGCSGFPRSFPLRAYYCMEVRRTTVSAFIALLERIIEPRRMMDEGVDYKLFYVLTLGLTLSPSVTPAFAAFLWVMLCKNCRRPIFSVI